MSKVEMNNEIILLRSAIRQARVCVINKLIREAKRLRSKHGNEQQQEKYKNKADRLISEIHTLKTIKDDDISKFGIINEKDLNDILQDQSLSENTRVIARVAHHKSLYKRFILIREKFPYYKKYLNEKKKKTTKVKSKNIVQVKKSSKEQNHQILKKQKINDSDKNIKCSEYDGNDKEIELPKVENDLCKFENSEKQILTKPKKDSVIENVVVNKQADIIKPHSISKEATVKKFTELLEEQDSDKDTEIVVKDIDPINAVVVSEKTVDDFFLTENNQNYQESSTNPSTLYSKSDKNNIRTETFRSNNRIQKQNSKYKNNKNFNKIERCNELKDILKSDRINVNNKQSSPARQKRKTCNRTNKMTRKSNTDDVNNKEDIALHPSWMAKKKQQEIMSQGFQGKKILFTED